MRASVLVKASSLALMDFYKWSHLLIWLIIGAKMHRHWSYAVGLMFHFWWHVEQWVEEWVLWIHQEGHHAGNRFGHIHVFTSARKTVTPFGTFATLSWKSRLFVPLWTAHSTPQMQMHNMDLRSGSENFKIDCCDSWFLSFQSAARLFLAVLCGIRIVKVFQLPCENVVARVTFLQAGGRNTAIQMFWMRNILDGGTVIVFRAILVALAVSWGWVVDHRPVQLPCERAER